MRLIAFLLALLAILFLGHALYEFIQFGLLAWLSLLAGLLAAFGAATLHRRGRTVAAETPMQSGDGHGAGLSVRDVSAEAVRPLRGLVLRPGQPPESLIYEGDDHPLALHVGAFDGPNLVGIATIYPEPPPAALRGQIPEEAYASGAAFRLRGMASHPSAERRGIGRAVLERCFDQVRASDADYLWCNARLVAVPFYEHLGLEAVGEQFDIPGIGPHYVMWRAL